MVDTGDLKSPARNRAYWFESSLRHHLFFMQILLFLLLVFSPHAHAEEVPVEGVYDNNRIELLLNNAVSRATAEVVGKGTTMQLTYSSPAELHVLVLFINSSGDFSPYDSLVVSLPAGNRKQVEARLAQSPAWSPLTKRYRLHFLSNTAEGATFEDIDFIGTGLFETISAGCLQFIAPLHYGPTSYHRLASYAVFGIPMVPLIGILVGVAVVTLLVLQKRKAALTCLVVGLLLIQLRFSVDTVRFAIKNSSSWFNNQSYAAAGSLPTIGQDLQNEGADGVYLCTSGTSYARRILAYHAFPILVTADKPTHIAVHASLDWSYELGTLRCGKDVFRAKKIKEYPNGDALFAVMNT